MDIRGSRRETTAGRFPFEDGPYEVFRPYLHPGERDSLDPAGLREVVRKRLFRSSVPLPTLIHFARRAGFAAVGLLEEVASAPPEPDPAESPPGQDVSIPGLEEILARIPSTLGESREGQSEMSRVVMESLEAGEIALIEAATGTGKSLAYLVPAVIRSMGSGARTVISTHTKNLQDQLVTKEIPNIEKLFGNRIPAARLLGRESYICSRRLVSRVTRIAEEDPVTAFRASISAALCRDGIAGMLSGDSGISRPSSVSAPPRCRMKGCSAGDSCPLVTARERARKARILFVNHALALTDYVQGGAIIGPRDGMVFDEAHHLEDTVMDNLSVRVATADIERIFEELSPFGEAEKRWKYLAGELEAVQSGTDWRRLIARAAEAAAQLEEGVKKFFGSLTSLYSGRQDLRGARTRYFDGGEAFADLRDELLDITIYIKLLKDTLKPVTEPSLPPAGEAMQSEIEYALDELAEFGERMDYLAGARDEESVFWIEWSPAGRAFALCGSPLDVGRRFADFLQDSCRSAILTSATLAQGGSFEYTRSRLGLDLPGVSTRELLVESPFSLDENCRIILQTDLGDPNGKGFAAEVAGVTASLSRETGRSILVLLTSYRLCNEIARSLEDEQLDGPILTQEGRAGREALATRFRSSETPVLLGVASFWEGVDFPGEELELLIIPKLPFPVPTDPVIEARSDLLRKAGENPFTKLHLPLAVQRLRQGVGRLIRRKDDRGMVVILDSRMGSRPYGRTISASLPVGVGVTGSTGETVAMAAGWFGGKNRVEEAEKKG